MIKWSFMPQPPLENVEVPATRGEPTKCFPTFDDENETQEAAIESLQWLLGCLRAQYWNYQESHWQVKGSSFYGDHLLFERLYKSVVDQIDNLAEKMVGMYGPEAVNGLDVGAKVEVFIKQWGQVSCLHKRGLLSEQGFQTLCEWVYDKLGVLGELTLGMDDFLMSIASEHETNEYLLRQTLRSQKFAKQISQEWEKLSKGT